MGLQVCIYLWAIIYCDDSDYILRLWIECRMNSNTWRDLQGWQRLHMRCYFKIYYTTILICFRDTRSLLQHSKHLQILLNPSQGFCWISWSLKTCAWGHIRLLLDWTIHLHYMQFAASFDVQYPLQPSQYGMMIAATQCAWFLDFESELHGFCIAFTWWVFDRARKNCRSKGTCISKPDIYFENWFIDAPLLLLMIRDIDVVATSWVNVKNKNSQPVNKDRSKMSESCSFQSRASFILYLF